MRGGYSDPTPNTAHASAYSPLMDGMTYHRPMLVGPATMFSRHPASRSSEHIWSGKTRSFAHDVPGMPTNMRQCHMDGRDDVAADFPGVPLRRVHAHGMPGVDVAITDFPGIEEAQVTEIQRLLDTSLFTEIHVCDLGGAVEVTLDMENIASGHSWPSGAAHDRRSWVELVAYEGEEMVYSSGLLSPGQALTDLDDPNLWRFGDIGTDDEGHEVHMFWDITQIEPTSPSTHNVRYHRSRMDRYTPLTPLPHR